MATPPCIPEIRGSSTMCSGSSIPNTATSWYKCVYVFMIKKTKIRSSPYQEKSKTLKECLRMSITFKRKFGIFQIWIVMSWLTKRYLTSKVLEGIARWSKECLLRRPCKTGQLTDCYLGQGERFHATDWLLYRACSLLTS